MYGRIMVLRARGCCQPHDVFGDAWREGQAVAHHHHVVLVYVGLCQSCSHHPGFLQQWAQCYGFVNVPAGSVMNQIVVRDLKTWVQSRLHLCAVFRSIPVMWLVISFFCSQVWLPASPLCCRWPEAGDVPAFTSSSLLAGLLLGESSLCMSALVWSRDFLHAMYSYSTNAPRPIS